MAATDRRVNSARRGMTVLGKVPVVPKPINLPSQRLENQGLFPDVDIVPRGTCSWGSAGRFPGASGNKSRKAASPSSNSLSTGGEQENGGKVESRPVPKTSSRNSTDKDGGLLETSKQVSSAKATTSQHSNGKIEEPRNSNSYTHNSLDSQKQETTETPLQKSGDGYMQGGSVPPGFGHCGPHVNHSRAGVSTSDLQCNGIGAGMYPNTSQQNGLHNIPGVPYYNGKKEREIIVIHMVGSPGFYGNYPPQLGYPDNYYRNGLYGNFPLQFGNFEPYFGFQGHGGVDGGYPISAATGSDLFDEHEDFVCYEKECYHGRQKNGLVRGSSQENTFLGRAQRDVHEALISRSSLKSRSSSQKHFPRNVGRLRSLYHNGRLVPIEEASAMPVPEKRITLLTKVSQNKLLTIKSLGETGVSEVAHAEGVVGSDVLACGDEGKAPETFEADTVIEDAQVKKTGASASLKMAEEVSLSKQFELGTSEVSVLTTTCNDKCLHCKSEAVVAPALIVCQACKKTSVCENNSSTSQCCLRPIKEVPLESTDKSNSSDGCTVEVKHVIFDADSCNLSTVKGQDDASSSSSMEAAASDRQLDIQSSMTPRKKSPMLNDEEGEGKQRLLVKKGNTVGKWKPKRPAGAAKVDFKVFAPKIRKAAARKNTPKTFASECVSDATPSTMCNIKDSMGNLCADSIRLSSQTETHNRHQESLSSSSLSSLGDVFIDDSHEPATEKSNGATFVDCIAAEGYVQTKKGKNTHKMTLHKDCHDNVTTVHPVESLVKRDIFSTDVKKTEPKGADSTYESAWRPKVPTALQSKCAIKMSGIRVSKAHVVSRKLGFQGRKSQSVVNSSFSGESSEAAKEVENGLQKSSPPSTSQLCNSEVLKTNKSQSFEAPSKSSAKGQQSQAFEARLNTNKSQSFEPLSKSSVAKGQQSLAFRKRSADQAALGRQQSSRDTSSNKQPLGSLGASSKDECVVEHTKQSLCSTSPGENNSADVNFSGSASEYHMIRRRVYHVVEGSGGDYFVPSLSLTGKSHQTGDPRSLQTTTMQNQKQLQKKTVSPSSGSSYTESEHSEVSPSSGSSYIEAEHSEVFSDSMCILESKSCRSQSTGVARSVHATVPVNQHINGFSSKSEENKTKKNVRPGKLSSTWKPKAAPDSRVLEDIFQKKDNNESETLISTPVEVAYKEMNDSACPGQFLASSHLHAGENIEEPTIENHWELPLELESVGHLSLKEVHHSLEQDDTLLGNENKVVVDSQKSSKIVVSMEEMEHGSVLKKVKEVPPLEPLGPVGSFKETATVAALEQATPTCSQESTGGNCRPFFQKKNVMSYEKANRYHQIMFKKYKQTGHWKPKAHLHSEVVKESDCASQNEMEAPMKVVLMVVA